jgi:hypothetical protein
MDSIFIFLTGFTGLTGFISPAARGVSALLPEPKAV